MICANSLREEGAGFGTATNHLTLISREHEVDLPMLSKSDAADALLTELFSLDPLPASTEGVAMLLTVDIGNTNVVMGLMPTRGELASQLRFPTDKRRTVREFMDGFEALVAMHGFDFSDVAGAVVSSVVPELTGIGRGFGSRENESRAACGGL